MIAVERSALLRSEHPAAIESRAELTAGRPAVIVANELLDNLPFRLLERGVDEWNEVFVEAGSEVLKPTDDPGFDVPIGARIPLQEQAAAWVAAAARPLVVIDYAATTAELAARPWREWVRTYASHNRGDHPWLAAGTQDITVEVAIDQLPEPDRVVTQADWLDELNIAELVEEGRESWLAQASSGSLAAFEGRSRVREAEALTDPAGLGAFTVAEWLT